MIKNKRNGDIIDTDMPIIAVPVTTTGENIPKILRVFKECLSEYKRIIKKSSGEGLIGRCIPIFNRDEKCFALMFTKGYGAEYESNAIQQLEYYSDVTDCGVAFKSGDFDESIIDNIITHDVEMWD